MGYFFVVPGILFAYSLGYFCSPTSKTTHNKRSSFYCGIPSVIIVGYFFVVPGKLFAYSLGNFLQSHIEDNSPHYSFSFTAYKAASGGSDLWCGTAKSFSGSTQIVFLGQQKSSPQVYKNVLLLYYIKLFG